MPFEERKKSYMDSLYSISTLLKRWHTEIHRRDVSKNYMIEKLKFKQPDYLKIDVDGIEHLILSGGEKVLLNTKEILIEINDKFEEQKNNCTKSLKRLGFSLKEKRKTMIKVRYIRYGKKVSCSRM